MKRIVLIRHAKSSWSDPDQDDLERGLNQRGRFGCALMGAWLAEMQLVPDHVWLSPSVRTTETWKRMRVVAGGAEGTVHKAAYMADPDTILNLIRATPHGDTVAVVGHQPGMSATARKLSDGKIATNCARAFNHFPTSGVAVLETAAETWAEVAFKGCKFTHYAMPKDLI